MGAGTRDESMISRYPSRVRIVEVGPRDGLQNETEMVDPAARARFIDRLAASGLAEVEVGSFVSPRWIPQLADTEEVIARLAPHPGTTFTALVPNLRGLERAVASGVRSVAVFTAASETFSRKNTNASIDESLERFKPVVEQARAAGIRIRGYVSTAFACPFEGPIAPAQSVAVVLRLFDLGVEEVSVGDTIGAATPRDVGRFFNAAAGRIDPARTAFHFHDTYAMGIANVVAALDAGATIFDASAGGLGGCPYAPGAAGNLATEDLLYLLHGLGIETGVDIGGVIEASALIEAGIGHPLPSKVFKALRAARPPAQDGGVASCGA
jgi:hydroxymethylglutaryl-CoA lyase